MIIAIDGTSASGKSTVAKMLSDELNFVNLNSGNLYRALAYIVLENKIDYLDENSTIAFAGKQDLKMVFKDKIFLGDRQLEICNLRTPQVDNVSSKISFYIPVRQKVNKILREFAESYDVVCEGRDITSIVFPDTPYKFFIDADVSERARRRTKDYNDNYEMVLEELKKRDTDDYSKPFGALKIVKGAIFINSTHKTPRQVCDIIKENIFN